MADLCGRAGKESAWGEGCWGAVQLQLAASETVAAALNQACEREDLSAITLSRRPIDAGAACLMCRQRGSRR